MYKRISAGLIGGAMGSLVDSFNIWVLGKAGVTALLGIGLKPHFTKAWLYPRLVWGGLFGLLFMLPFDKGHPVRKGILVSMAPSVMVLFVVFPDMGKGILGLGFGTLTPVLVILLNCIWGIVGAFWYRSACR